MRFLSVLWKAFQRLDEASREDGSFPHSCQFNEATPAISFVPLPFLRLSSFSLFLPLKSLSPLRLPPPLLQNRTSERQNRNNISNLLLKPSLAVAPFVRQAGSKVCFDGKNEFAGGKHLSNKGLVLVEQKWLSPRQSAVAAPLESVRAI